MTTMVLKGLLGLAAACVFIAVSAALFLTRRNLGSRLQALGIGCFGVMALTHVFEAFSIAPTFGWGRPRSFGHFIDLVAAVLGVTLVVTSFLLQHRTPLWCRARRLLWMSLSRAHSLRHWKPR
jgi:hypothetical protein